MLLDDFTEAKAGDFVVYLHQKQLTLLVIKEKKGDCIVFEEISAPQAAVDEYNGKWGRWLQEGAPLHTSWTISTMDLQSHMMLALYSVDTGIHSKPEGLFHFLPTLLSLPLHRVDLSERKYVGPPPMPGEPDFRKLWYPKIVYEGAIIHPEICVRKIIWPQDGSNLAGKTIELYLAGKPAISYFPYYIQFIAGIKKVQLQVIDSGRDLHIYTQ